MEFIKADDNSDNVLIWQESDIICANETLLALAKGFSLAEDEIRIPPSFPVKRLGIAIACRERAAAMVGSDATIGLGGDRREDIYLQKYNLYRKMVIDAQARLSFKDFSKDGVNSSGKGGIGVISLSRS